MLFIFDDTFNQRTSQQNNLNIKREGNFDFA